MSLYNPALNIHHALLTKGMLRYEDIKKECEWESDTRGIFWTDLELRAAINELIRLDYVEVTEGRYYRCKGKK